MKNFKTFYWTQTAGPLRKIIQSPTRQKLPTFLQKYKEICRHFLSKHFKNAFSWASRNGAVYMFFLTPTRNMFAEKFVK